MFKVKNTNRHVTYIPEAQIFICFALRRAVHELLPNFQKSAPNDPHMTLTCSRSKTPTCMLHTPPRPKFSSVSLYDKQFLSYGPIFGKSAPNDPNDLDMFKVKNNNMHVGIFAHFYTPRPKFSPVSLYDKPFLSYGPIFGKSTPNDPK